jgi:hypothetical protein
MAISISVQSALVDTIRSAVFGSMIVLPLESVKVIIVALVFSWPLPACWVQPALITVSMRTAQTISIKYFFIVSIDIT